MSAVIKVACLCLGAALVGFADDAVTEAKARERFAEYLEKLHPGASIRTFASIPREGDDLAEVRREYTVYRAVTTCKEVPLGIFILLFDRAGGMMDWNGEDRVPDLQKILERCGLRATDEAGVRRAGLVCLLTPVENKYEAERVEVSDRTFVYHRHLLVLMSGRVGVYSEDVVVRFDANGRLASFEVTGIDDLTVEQRDALTRDPDPWLQVIGAVPDDVRERVSAKGRERKLPIEHKGE